MEKPYRENRIECPRKQTESIFYMSEGEIQELEIDTPPKTETSQLLNIVAKAEK